jgi:hypothetical protein
MERKTVRLSEIYFNYLQLYTIDFLMYTIFIDVYEGFKFYVKT